MLRFRSSVQHHSGLQFASYVLELSILTLILLNVVVAISETSAVVDAHATGSSNGPKPVVNDWTDIFLLVSTMIFSIEYMLRLWSCVEDDRYRAGAILGRYVSTDILGCKRSSTKVVLWYLEAEMDDATVVSD